METEILGLIYHCPITQKWSARLFSEENIKEFDDMPSAAGFLANEGANALEVTAGFRHAKGPLADFIPCQPIGAPHQARFRCSRCGAALDKSGPLCQDCLKLSTKEQK